MKQREIIVEHKYINGKREHCFNDENYNLLELERKVYLNENERLNNIIDKAIEYMRKVINENEEWDMYRENKLLNILEGEK